MNLKNSIDTRVFQDELDFKTLENILECLDYVIPKKVSRQEYNVMKWNFLVETWEDKFGKSYDLFLPEDLVHWELLNLIDFLSRKFWIENYNPYSRIITKTKVMIWMIMRKWVRKIFTRTISEIFTISRIYYKTESSKRRLI